VLTMGEEYTIDMVFRTSENRRDVVTSFHRTRT